MSHVAVYLTAFFPIHNMFMGAATAGFTPATWTRRESDQVNHPVWILAHLTAIRRGIARNLGAELPPEPWEMEVAFGSQCKPADQYPAPDKLLVEFTSRGMDIAQRLGKADDATLQKKFEPTFPDGHDRTVIAALGFLVSHEALHIGQISFFRRLQKLPGLATVALEQMRAQQRG